MCIIVFPSWQPCINNLLAFNQEKLKLKCKFNVLQLKLLLLCMEFVPLYVNWVRVVRKKGKEEGRVGCETGEERDFPSHCPNMQADQSWGQQFHFNHPPWSSYCFSFLLAAPQFSRTHRNMACTSYLWHLHRMCTQWIYKHTQLIESKGRCLVSYCIYTPAECKPVTSNWHWHLELNNSCASSNSDRPRGLWL